MAWCVVVQCGEACRVVERKPQKKWDFDEGGGAGFNLLVVAHADGAVEL